MRKNPFQFVEPTFGDGFHLKGATGYSQYSDGTKSPHTIYYADQGAVERALATFLYLEKAGNLRSATRVPVSNEMAICVDLPDGRRFFAGNQGADIWIKELVSADGHAAGSQEPTSWNKWSSKGIFPKTTWFQSRASSNPVRHRSQLTAAQRAKRTALWQNKRETKDSSAERLRCQLCGPDKGMSPFGELHVCEDCAKAYDNTNRRERRLPLRQEYLDLEAARTPEADLHEAIEARLSAKVAKRRGEANWAGEPETSNEAARYERRRERRAERRAQEVALKAFQNPVWIRPEGSARARAMETAYDEAYDNPGAQKLEAFSPGEEVEVMFSTLGEERWYGGRVVIPQFGDRYVVAVEGRKGDGEQQYSVPGLHVRRKVSAAPKAREATTVRGKGDWVKEQRYPATNWFVQKGKGNPRAPTEAYDNPGRAVYAAFAQAAKAKGKTPAQVKTAYAKKKESEKPVNSKKFTRMVELEIVAATQKHIGDPSFLWEAGMLETDPFHKIVRVVLSSSKHSAWEVDDPKYVAALRAIAKKHENKGLKMTVAVRNPRATAVPKGWIAGIQKHAMNNYNRDGWDYIVEAFEDDELAELIKNSPNYAEALHKVAMLAKDMNDRRADARAAGGRD